MRFLTIFIKLKSEERGHTAAQIRGAVGYITSTKFKRFKAAFREPFLKTLLYRRFPGMPFKVLKPGLKPVLNTLKRALKDFLKIVQKHQKPHPLILKIAHRTHRKTLKKRVAEKLRSWEALCAKGGFV
jgi:hypothetical protein